MRSSGNMTRSVRDGTFQCFILFKWLDFVFGKMNMVSGLFFVMTNHLHILLPSISSKLRWYQAAEIKSMAHEGKKGTLTYTFAYRLPVIWPEIHSHYAYEMSVRYKSEKSIGFGDRATARLYSSGKSSPSCCLGECRANELTHCWYVADACISTHHTKAKRHSWPPKKTF